MWATSATSIVVNGEDPHNRNYTVYAGWNLIGWSQVSDGSVANDIAPQVSAGPVDDIAYWNSTTQSYDLFTAFPPDLPIRPGMGLFVWSDVTKNITYGS